MLVIRRCLFGSFKGAGDEKNKYYDIPSFPDEGFPLISTDPLHAPPEEAQSSQPNSEVENGDESEIESQTSETLAEEPLSDETIVEEPQPDETLKVPQPEETLMEEPQDLSALFGLREPDRSSLYTCTEILGLESCDNMVKEMSEAMTEWSWSRKRQKQKAIDTEILANRRRFPPPTPRYIGRQCEFMKIERCNGRITMSLVQMDRQLEQMQIEREDGQVQMQLMTYVGDAWNDDAEASTSQQVDEEMTSDEEEEELVTDKLDSGGPPQKKCLALAA